jgi:uncharacterized membrane protein YqjE
MLPPLLRVLLAQPTLLTDYASAYAALLRQDVAWWQARQLRKLGYLLAAAGAGVLALLFAGVALMLYAVTGDGHWLLWAVPVVTLLAAIVAAWRLARVSQTAPSFPRVREQLAQDMQLFGLKEPES